MRFADIGLAVVAAAGLVAPAAAQPVQIVHRFEVPPHAPLGGMVEHTDGFLYGTTARAEGGGAIVRVPVAGGALQIVARFERGNLPDTTLTLGQGGVLYGTTLRGDATTSYGGGTLFRFDPATAAISTLYTFDDTASFPGGRLVQGSDGRLFGTTPVGNGGYLYAFDPATGNIRFPYAFATDDPLGAQPVGGLTEGADGALYGVTRGGTTTPGTIVRFDRTSGAIERVHTFNFVDAATPVAGLTRTSDGAFYGVTRYGSLGEGSIFRFDPVTRAMTVVHAFAATGPRIPLSRLVEASDGSLFGTTADTGVGGSIFRLQRLAGGSHAFSVVQTLDPAAHGTAPIADLALASDGFVYGAAHAAGPAGGGTVFRFDSLARGSGGNTWQFSVVHAYSVRGPGWRPNAPPVTGPDGALYGLTSRGGANERGDAYRLDPVTYARTVVGAVPGLPLVQSELPGTSRLVPGGDGSLYATSAGLNATEGRILRVTPATNSVTTAVTLPTGSPTVFLSGLSANQAGIFGVRSLSDSTVELYRFTPAANAVTRVAVLESGIAFGAGLTAASDGQVYVTLLLAGAIGRNPVAVSRLLRADPATGTVTALHSGFGSYGPAVAPGLAPDGSIVFSGGDSVGLSGAVLALQPSTGAVRTVCSLSAYANVAALALTPDGGAAVAVAGAPNVGQVLYRCPLAGGAAMALHAFDPRDGAVSQLAFVNGNLFVGTTDGGLALDLLLSTEAPRGGTLFRFAAVGTTPIFDPDGDGLSSTFESTYGFSQTSGAGDDGAAGDPDEDGQTNLQEQAAGTHPRGVMTRYLAEGASNAYFKTRIALGNASDVPATVLLRFLTDAGATVPHVVTVPPRSRGTVDAASVVGLGPGSFSTVVESDVDVTVDRTMTWDVNAFGSHAETAVVAPSTTWFFAEGSTSSVFSLFYLLQNPQDSAVTATVRYLRPLGLPPIERTYTLPPRSRTTIAVDGEGPELASTDVSAAITATAPIIAERAMYRDGPVQAFAAGHDSAGVTAAATRWFLAEGATGTFFDLFVLVANPNDTPATITAEYLRVGGGSYSKSYTVPANGRLTIWVDDEQLPAGSGQRPLASASLSTTVTANQPVVVERTMWWPGPEVSADFWYESHNSPGSIVEGLRWGIAGGDTSLTNAADTYVLIANPGDVAGQATVRLYFANGNTAARTFQLPAKSRTTVSVATGFPETTTRGPVSIVVEGTVPIVVESASYASPLGLQWSAGTNALATLLDVPVPAPAVP